MLENRVEKGRSAHARILVLHPVQVLPSTNPFLRLSLFGWAVVMSPQGESVPSGFTTRNRSPALHPGIPVSSKKATMLFRKVALDFTVPCWDW